MEFAIIAMLLAASAFFSGGELALMTLNPVRLETQAREGSRLAAVQQRIRANPQRFLSCILIGNNAVNITMASLATVIALHMLGPGLGEQNAVIVATVTITILTVLFAELLPKTLAAVNGERFASFVTYPLFGLSRVLAPLSIVLEAVVNPLVRLLSGGHAPQSHAPGREEMLTALRLSHSAGQLHAIDAQVAREALAFSTLDLRDVMTPRVDVTGIEVDATLGEAVATMRRTGYSRLPVYQEGLDHVVGVLLLKDMVAVMADEAEDGQPRDWFNEPVSAHMREVEFLPETKSIVDALSEVRRLRSHMIIVVDEHGGTAGVVTLEDILEELIGDIRDESDPDHSTDIIHRGEGHLIVSGRARLDNLPELGDVRLEELESTTVGGVLMERLGRTVNVGDTVQIEYLSLTALKVLGNRVKLVRIDYPDPETPAGSD